MRLETLLILAAAAQMIEIWIGLSICFILAVNYLAKLLVRK